MTDTAAFEARRLLRRTDAGMLATASQRFDGHPFGSVVRYAQDGSGRPLILISRLAEHTRNIEADPRVSLLAVERGRDPQADARVAVVGRCRALGANDAAAARYLRRFPDAEALLALGDFAFYAIDPLSVRFIAGFGRIHWLPPGAVLAGDSALAAAEPQLLAELAGADLAALWARHGEAPAGQVVACAVDPDGLELRAGNRLLRIEFNAPARDLASARAALEQLLTGAGP